MSSQENNSVSPDLFSSDCDSDINSNNIGKKPVIIQTLDNQLVDNFTGTTSFNSLTNNSEVQRIVKHTSNLSIDSSSPVVKPRRRILMPILESPQTNNTNNFLRTNNNNNFLGDIQVLTQEIDVDDLENNNFNATKRQRRKYPEPSEWKKNKRQKLRNLGADYINSKNQTISAKKLGEICTCKRKCATQIPNDFRERLFTNFWALGNSHQQSELLSSLVIQDLKARNRSVGPSRRVHSLKWRMKKNDEMIQVCKIFFLNTFQVSEKRVRVAVKKKSQSITGAIGLDGRGRFPPKNKLSENAHELVLEHIRSLPLTPAHYVRHNSSRVYVEGNISQAKAYRLYEAFALSKNQEPVSKPIYIKHLKNSNISFHQPRKDRCWCTDFHTWDKNDQDDQQDEYNTHLIRKDRARAEKIKDEELSKTNKTMMTACFDLQAILFSPMLYNKDIYYKRKLASFNLTVYVSNQKQGHCYMWDELQGSKGSIEISSCLYEFFSKEISDKMKIINLYADNCPGQNKNSIVVAMLIHAIASHPSLEIINLKFLEVGHTYQEADSVHSLINRASRKERIYVPDDWQRVARQAKQDQKPYVVHEMNQTKFLDFKAYKLQAGLDGKLVTTDGSTLKWKNLRFIQLRKNSPKKLFVKTDYEDDFQVIRVNRFRALPLNQMYHALFPISAAKYNDLISLCNQHVIVRQHHEFYKNLPHTGGREPQSNEDDNDVFDGRGQMPGMIKKK